MRCSRPRSRARPRKAEAREGITRYSVEDENDNEHDDEDEKKNDSRIVLLLVLQKRRIVKGLLDQPKIKKRRSNHEH